MWLQVREWDRWRAARVEQAAVGMTGGHQGLHRRGGKPAASFLWLPGELAMVLLLLSYPMQRKTIFLSCQRWKQSEQKERTSQVSIPGNIIPQPILTSYLLHHLLYYNHISLAGLPVSGPFPFQSTLHPVFRDPGKQHVSQLKSL